MGATLVLDDSRFELRWPQKFLEKKGPNTFLKKREPNDDAGLSRPALLEIYRFIFEIRELDSMLSSMFRQNKIIGGFYSSLGQEAVAVGCAYAMRDGDILQPLIRDTGASLVHGVLPIAFFRQYMAKVTGPSGGRDLNGHFGDTRAGILGPVSMLGAMVPVLAGALLASRLLHEERVGLSFIGDGGSSTGAYFEGMNFAAVQNLPMISVIEANHYAYSTPSKAQIRGGDMMTRASAFGVPVLRFDGNDVLAAFEATEWARKRARDGEGPTILVAETYRRRGHAEHDGQYYVPKGEVEAWEKKNDPLNRYESWLSARGYVKDIKTIQGEVKENLRRDRDQAEAEPAPDLGTLKLGVFEDLSQAHPPLDTWFQRRAKYRGDKYG